jgi:hypothetical protein
MTRIAKEIVLCFSAEGIYLISIFTVKLVLHNNNPKIQIN